MTQNGSRFRCAARRLAAPILVALGAALAACGGEGVAPTSAGAISPTKAVLIAGDDSIPVFDDATLGVAAWLASRGVHEGDIVRLSAQPSVVARGAARPATLDNILRAVSSMAPQPGQGCLVYATSHGIRARGLFLAAGDEWLPRDLLAQAVDRGCGDAPTVLVLSGCYSGLYAGAPLAKPNRIVLTAARADRSSFGCGAGRLYTIYDSCMLDALPRAATWHALSDEVGACIATAEREGGFAPPSQPQAVFGAAVAAAALPGTAPPLTRITARP